MGQVSAAAENNAIF
jgi:hypothetical protein